MKIYKLFYFFNLLFIINFLLIPCLCLDHINSFPKNEQDDSILKSKDLDKINLNLEKKKKKKKIILFSSIAGAIALAASIALGITIFKKRKKDKDSKKKLAGLPKKKDDLPKKKDDLPKEKDDLLEIKTIPAQIDKTKTSPELGIEEFLEREPYIPTKEQISPEIITMSNYFYKIYRNKSFNREFFIQQLREDVYDYCGMHRLRYTNDLSNQVVNTIMGLKSLPPLSIDEKLG